MAPIQSGAVIERHMRVWPGNLDINGHMNNACYLTIIDRCAVSFAGVSNLIDISRHESRFIGAEVADKQIGNYWRDRDQLKKTSPSERAREITVPVLLVHSTQDRSVPYEQSETMAHALKVAGKPFKFVTLTDGDHHLSRQADQLQFFSELGAFLAVHLGSTAAH